MKAIMGKKLGMTQIFAEDGRLIPVTVIEAGPMVVTQIKTKENDGYEVLQSPPRLAGKNGVSCLQIVEGLLNIHRVHRPDRGA